MKRYVLTAIVSLLVVCFIAPAFAVDVMVGAKTGYFMWRPYFKDVETGFFQDIKNGTGALYGPALSVIFNEQFSFSGVALFGTQQAHWTLDNSYDTAETKYRNGTYYIESHRIDIDSALSYRLSGSFKLFAGYKYQRVVSTVKYTEQQSQDLNNDELIAYKETDKITALQHGPALGVGYSLPFGGNMFFSTNVSLIYMWGQFKVVLDSVLYDETLGFQPQHIRNDYKLIELDTTSFGVNVEPAFGVQVNKNLVLTLGVRYQWLHINTEDFEEKPKNGLNDHLVGGFVSVLLVF